ncbi:hypothetical protein MMC22_008667 [Lobaria immixta]|nr:hypothetical protein [Lobaria immixta]
MDEIGAIQGAEMLIPIAHNIESVEKIVGVGDPNQLAPVIVTCKKKHGDGGMINEFANALVQPLILRAQLAGLQGSMFTNVSDAQKDYTSHHLTCSMALR